ncbi:MAG TPA: hypothetical protein VL137_05710 [Polyangiaceae bacterium]|nr:hypothetical protein [Polyangiaceae bacterium]
MTPAPQIAPPARGKARKIALALLLLLVALGAGAAFLFPGWLRDRIQCEALQRGVVLDFKDFDLSFNALTLSALQLDQVTFSADKPLTISGSADLMVIALTDFEPRSITLQKAQIDVTASGEEVLQQLTGQAQSSPAGAASGLDVSATDVQLRWKPSSSAEPLLTVGGANFSTTGGGITLGGAFGLGKVALGNAQVNWNRAQHSAAIDLALSSPLPAHISGHLRADADPINLTLDLHETALPALLLALPGMTDFSKTTLSGMVQMQWPQGLSTQPAGGKAYLTLKNFTPPHPIELKGFDFGKQTDVQTDFSFSRDRRSLLLEHTHLQAGSFALNGQGQLDAARATLQLAGSLSCSLLAKAAAEAHLGTVLGQWAGKLARKQVEGDVNFQINANWDFSAGIMPHVTRKIEPGCGLKPIKLQDLPLFNRLGLNLDELAAQMQEALPGLPALPPAPKLLPDPALLPRLPHD